jgi:hypothetical protein
MPSTVIGWFDYHPEKRKLEIHFVTGRRYVYFEVPQEEFDCLRAAGSRGRYFNQHIRDRYEYRELERSSRE